MNMTAIELFNRLKAKEAFVRFDIDPENYINDKFVLKVNDRDVKSIAEIKIDGVDGFTMDVIDDNGIDSFTVKFYHDEVINVYFYIVETASLLLTEL